MEARPFTTLLSVTHGLFLSDGEPAVGRKLVWEADGMVKSCLMDTRHSSKSSVSISANNVTAAIEWNLDLAENEKCWSQNSALFSKCSCFTKGRDRQGRRCSDVLGICTRHCSLTAQSVLHAYSLKLCCIPLSGEVGWYLFFDANDRPIHSSFVWQS